ncbi:proton channel OTOP2-like isoform X2 [Embiotoca jacksoni]|uniref:proton channel OTOP2-like isoform X2 n=1 Tax=Embiotoca jacksoni TaxID=100190 RepID=UPI0037038A2D
MTARDRETEQAHLSNSINAPGHAGSASEPDLNILSSDVVRERGRNWGWMLSGIICVNILILGCALVSGSTYDNVNIDPPDMQIFVIILLFLTSFWMLYYAFYTVKKEDAIIYKDGHAGPVWLRGGLVLFGLLSVIMDIFKIASYVGYLHCDSAVQTYFLWIHAKDCIQLQKNISCCGLMLTLSTNLVLWMTAVADESVHQTIIPDYLTNITRLFGRNLYISKAGFGDTNCKCSHTSCSIFKEAYYYLYPFNIEYSLFASAMAYVMWKNVGRVAAEDDHHIIKFCLKDIFLGPVLGVLLVFIGLATFIVYEMIMTKLDSEEDKKDKAVMMHFVINIIIAAMMSVSTVIGGTVYRLDHREHVSEKNPTRTLDVGLLVGASLGQLIISYFTIVAMIATGAKGYLNRLNLTWALLMVIQLSLQNLFIIEGLHRQPFHEEQSVTALANPYVLQPTDLGRLEQSDMGTKPNPVLTDHAVHGHATAHGHAIEHKHKLSWKRRILKEVCAFLLLGNIILWIMPAFGARPQFDHDAETEFYKFNMWAAVVNVGLPFGIFYRMHSVASLFEVFLSL